MSWQPQKPPFVDFKKFTFAKAGKVSEFIYQIGEYDALRKPSKPVPVKEIRSVDFIKKISYLKTCLLKYQKITGYGRGITAVQVGISQRFSVIYTPDKLIVIINPTITKVSDIKLLYPEICMSANPIIAPTVRPAWIEFDYYDEQGVVQHWDTKADDKNGQLMNRVFLHEIDHMNGIINIDLVAHTSDLILESDPHFYDKATFRAVVSTTQVTILTSKKNNYRLTYPDTLVTSHHYASRKTRI